MFKSLISAGLLFGLSHWQGLKVEGVRMLRQKIGGALILFLALQLVFLSLIFFAAAFFLGLADIDAWIKPALITGGIVIAIAGVLAFEGFRWLKM